MKNAPQIGSGSASVDIFIERSLKWDEAPPLPVIHRIQPAPGFSDDIISRAEYCAENAATLCEYWFELFENSGATVLSLDVFDNLLLRNNKPEAARYVELSERIATNLARASAQRSGDAPFSADDVLLSRVAGLKLAYRAAPLVGGFREGRIETVYRTMARLLGLSEDERRALASEELAYERQNLSLNVALEALVHKVKKNDVEVILLSDMYLSGSAIANLVEHVSENRLQFDADRVFSSADMGANKRGGSAFGYVERAMSRQPRAFCHIGDSLRSDVTNAVAAGWAAIHFPVTKREESIRRQRFATCIDTLQKRGIETVGWAQL